MKSRKEKYPCLLGFYGLYKPLKLIVLFLIVQMKYALVDDDSIKDGYKYQVTLT